MRQLLDRYDHFSLIFFYLVCHTEEGVRQSGETWISYESPCVSCQCREGVVTCSKLPCHCTSTSSSSSPPASSSSSSDDLEATAKFGLHRNQTVVHHPNSELCCPQCRASKSQQCRHQEKSDVIFDSGQRWIYQCQSCECLVNWLNSISKLGDQLICHFVI